MVRKIIKTIEVEYIQVMDEDGTVDQSLMPNLSDSQIKALYEKMMLCRAFDDKGFNMQRQGRIGTFIQFKGQEAAQVGAASVLEDKDWMFPMYRSGAALITRKYPIHQLYLYYGGDERGLKTPEGQNNFVVSIPVGTQIPHATGTALASKLMKDGKVSMVYFGEGGTSKGDFHEGLNIAGVFQAPVVFVCENNQFAISVPRKNQTHAETIAQKSFAYGIKGIQVDGNDIFAVYKVAKEAVDNARAGKGPTLIECYTYRMADHSTSDDAKKYRSQQECDDWAKKDPISRLEKYMRAKGLLTDAYKAEIEQKSKETIEKEVEIYEKFPAPNAEDIAMYTFKEPSADLKEQIEQLKSFKD